jgi:hypothetical protein
MQKISPDFSLVGCRQQNEAPPAGSSSCRQAFEQGKPQTEAQGHRAGKPIDPC